MQTSYWSLCSWLVTCGSAVLQWFLLNCRVVVLESDSGQPESGNVDAAVPVDVVQMEADVNGLLDRIWCTNVVHSKYTARRPQLGR